MYRKKRLCLQGEVDAHVQNVSCDRTVPVKSKEPTRNSNPNKLISLCSPAIKRKLPIYFRSFESRLEMSITGREGGRNKIRSKRSSCHSINDNSLFLPKLLSFFGVFDALP